MLCWASVSFIYIHSLASYCTSTVLMCLWGPNIWMQFSQIQHKGHSKSGEATLKMSLISSVTFRKKIIKVIVWEKLVMLLLYKPFAKICHVLPSLTWKRSKPVTWKKKIKKHFTMKKTWLLRIVLELDKFLYQYSEWKITRITNYFIKNCKADV